MEETLIELGLTKNESRIYLSLLELGGSNPTKIASASGVHRVNVYDGLNKLKDRGLVSESTDKSKKIYTAAPPQSLKNLLHEKEIKLNKIIPQLELSGTLHKGKHDVQVFEGYDYIRNMFLNFLELNEDILDLRVPKFVLESMGSYFQSEIHKRRIAQKQNMYHIYNKDALERINFLNTLPFTHAGYLDESENHNVTTTICGNQVAIQVYYEDPKHKPMTILIKNKEIADAYKNNFFILWEKTIKP